jgi:hypothetical protein
LTVAAKVALVKTEQDFWKDFKNHQELKQKLSDHGLLIQPLVFEKKVVSVARCWMTLAKAHLAEAKVSCDKKLKRSFYSRNYYAVYNASKSVRYFSRGSVSAKGDDHQEVSNLPTTFPNSAEWGADLRKMYQFRLTADYDGWPHSTANLDADMESHLRKSRDFLKASRVFLQSEFGIKL